MGTWGQWHLSHQPAARRVRLRFLWQLSSGQGFPEPRRSLPCAGLRWPEGSKTVTLSRQEIQFLMCLSRGRLSLQPLRAAGEHHSPCCRAPVARALSLSCPGSRKGLLVPSLGVTPEAPHAGFGSDQLDLDILPVPKDSFKSSPTPLKPFWPMTQEPNGPPPVLSSSRKLFLLLGQLSLPEACSLRADPQIKYSVLGTVFRVLYTVFKIPAIL